VPICTNHLNLIETGFGVRGGFYQFKEGVLNLNGSSGKYGCPNSNILQRVGEALKGYTNSQGQVVSEVRIEASK